MNLVNMSEKFTGISHGGGRLKIRIKNICKYYLVVGNIIFFFWIGLIIVIYFQGENIREYCIHVPITEYYHFAVSDNNACLIDWSYIVGEPLIAFLWLYAMLISPAILAALALKIWAVFKQKKLSSKCDQTKIPGCF